MVDTGTDPGYNIFKVKQKDPVVRVDFLVQYLELANETRIILEFYHERLGKISNRNSRGSVWYFDGNRTCDRFLEEVGTG